MSENFPEQAKTPLFTSKRFIKAGAALIASISFSSACNEIPTGELVENPEATSQQEVILCYLEKPDCTRADLDSGWALGAVGIGNQIPVENIPSVCTENRDVADEREKDVPTWLLYAFIAVEDARFCEHDGLDYWALARAVVATASGDKQGASTTEMQLGRLIAPDIAPEDDLTRKVWEVFVAVPQLSEKYTKTEIIKTYFNIVYFGRGAYGIEAAAQAYYGISARDLTVAQSASLVALLQNPGKYEGSLNPEKDLEDQRLHIVERNEVIDKMVEYGYLQLTQRDLLDLKSQPLNRLPYGSAEYGSRTDLSNARSVGAEFAVIQILNDIKSDLKQAGLDEDTIYQIKSINTTISREAQIAANNAYSLHSAQLSPDGGEFGLVLVEETGAIVAYLPGIYQEGGPNIDLLRAPILGGSQDKPAFVASVMLVTDSNGNRITPETIVQDPAYFEWLNYDNSGSNYTPTEAANRCPGDSCTLRESIARSSNWGILGLVKDLEMQGVPALSTGFDIMNQFGMNCLNPVGPAGVVGACELTPTQRALGAIQMNGLQGRAIPEDNRGRLINSYSLDNGQVISVYNSALPYQQVIPIEIAQDVTTILKDAVAYGTARRLNETAQRTLVVAKTGTPQNNVAPGVNGYFEINNKKYGFAVVLRDPNNGSRSLGPDADGGNAPTKLAAQVIENLLDPQ